MPQTEPFLKRQTKNRRIFNWSNFVVKLAKLMKMSNRRFRQSNLQIEKKICGESCIIIMFIWYAGIGTAEVLLVPQVVPITLAGCLS